MVNITSIRSANADFAGLPLAKGLVAVFGWFVPSIVTRSCSHANWHQLRLVGATAGIGESALRTFVANTVDPTVYFVGRYANLTSKFTLLAQIMPTSYQLRIRRQQDNSRPASP